MNLASSLRRSFAFLTLLLSCFTHRPRLTAAHLPPLYPPAVHVLLLSLPRLPTWARGVGSPAFPHQAVSPPSAPSAVGCIAGLCLGALNGWVGLLGVSFHLLDRRRSTSTFYGAGCSTRPGTVHQQAGKVRTLPSLTVLSIPGESW